MTHSKKPANQGGLKTSFIQHPLTSGRPAMVAQAPKGPAIDIGFRTPGVGGTRKGTR